MRPLTIAAALSMTLAFVFPAAAQEVTAGEKLFKKCAACHQAGEGAKNKVGPVLSDVVGRAAGSFERFKYGASMLAAGEAGLVWTPDNIFAYLANPKDFLRDYLSDPKAKAKMTFRLKDEQERRDVIAYLASFQTATATPTNGFCVTNNSGGTHLFAADAGDAGRVVGELSPGETLCTAESDTPQSGFVSVFESADHEEGCSRLVSNGMTEGLVKYADFDRCEWSSHAG